VSGSSVFAGAYGKVFCSTDAGAHWTALGTGLPKQAVYSLAVSGKYLYAGTAGRSVWRYRL